MQRFRTRRPNDVRQTSDGWEGNDVFSCERVPAEGREVGKRTCERHPLRERPSSTRIRTHPEREAERRRDCLASCPNDLSTRDEDGDEQNL